MTETLPLLATERLILVVPTPDDAERMVVYATSNMEHSGPWEPVRDEAYYTKAHWKATLEQGLENARAGRSLPLVLVDRDSPESSAVRGHVTLSNIVRGPFQAAFLGYSLSADCVGMGLMSEALTVVVAHAFGPMNLHRIMANTMPSNERSRAVLERLGFVREGFAKDYLYIAGQWEDHILHALVNPNWRDEEE